MLVTELVSTMWDTHVTLHCGHYSTQTYDAHDWSVASQTLLGPIKIRPVVCKICIEQPILCAKLTSSINYLLYWLWSSVSHILLKNSWRSNALAFSTGKSAKQAIVLMKMSGRLDHTGLVSPFPFWRATVRPARQNVRSTLLDSWCETMHALHTASEQNLSGPMRSLFSERSNWKQPNQQPSCQVCIVRGFLSCNVRN